MPITDCLLAGYAVQANHPSGGFFGAAIVGENFRRLLDAHPVYIDPKSSLAGGYMVNFMSYRKPHWNPDFDYRQLQADHQRYNLGPGGRHFATLLPGSGDRPGLGLGRHTEQDPVLPARKWRV